MYKNILEALRYASFTVGSTITTTGFVVVDYGKWPLLSQMIILVLTFVIYVLKFVYLISVY